MNRPWPPISEPELLDRLAMDAEHFDEFVALYMGALGRRTFQPTLFERALGYPWARPGASFILRGADVELIDDIDPDLIRDRHPILAFGSNAAPTTLTAKFAHFEDPDDRAVIVVAGDLHGFDVGAAACPTAYGAMPATLFASPGTAVRTAVLWVTVTQATQLCWSELSYRFGRLDGIRFDAGGVGDDLDTVFAYASRWGAFCVDGAPVALDAVPAKGRTATAMTQRELLDVVARLTLGPDADAETLVRAVFEDMSGLITRRGALVGSVQHFASTHWTPFPEL